MFRSLAFNYNIYCHNFKHGIAPSQVIDQNQIIESHQIIKPWQVIESIQIIEQR